MADDRALGSRGLLQVLGVGIGCWALAAVAWSVWTLVVRQGLEWLAFSVPFSAWSIWFVPAGVVMLAYGGWRACRGRIPANVLLWSMVVYFLPAVLAVAAWRLFLIAEPHTSQLSADVAMLGGAALFVLVFSGWVMGWMDRDLPLRQVVTSLLWPPAIGVGLLTLGFLVTVLGSVEWRHRHDFDLAIDRVTWAPGQLDVNATIDVRGEGTYQCWAWYRYHTAIGEAGVNGDVGWTDGDRMPHRPGLHRMRLRWDNLDNDAAVNNRKLELQVAGTLANGQFTFKKFLLPLPDPPAR